ncbi:MAG: hypothetical protein E7459_06430, partial [Ruminococcaceae bacterium]|nr:hypothetical protein [Oscillospiraceae bacterium]
MKKKLLALLLAMVLGVTCLVSPAMASPTDAQTSESLSDPTFIPKTVVDDEDVVEITEKDTTAKRIMVSVENGSTVFLQTSDLELAVAAADDQRTELHAAENAVASALGQDIQVEHYFSLLFNGFSFEGEAWMIEAICQIDGLSAMEAPVFELIEPEAEDTEIDLTPNTTTAVGMVGATDAWGLGYTGKGMVVAVIDTGIKQTHEAFSVEPEGAKIDKAYLENVFTQYGDKMHGKNPEGAYYNAKLPYNWDYFDNDHIPNHTQSAHGSHVAGIVAGNNGSNFKGIAPDAQIIPLQIFNYQGGATLDLMLASMEDCVYLGVDAVNMSLGIANAFETYEWPADFGPVFEALEKAGVAVCVSAGNDAHAYVSTIFGDWWKMRYQWSSSNPDHGIIGSPAIYTGAFAVGNSSNVVRTTVDMFKLGGVEILPNKTSAANGLRYSDIDAGLYQIVNCGTGNPDEFAAAGDLTGKIALVQQGGTYNGATITDDQKAARAAAAGAIGVLIYKETAGGAFTSGYADGIAVAAITLDDGKAIIAAMGNGNTTEMVLAHEFNYRTATMHYSSSYGPTAQLSIKPEITAPGTDINSVNGTQWTNDTAYTKMTGTSMAAPAISGGVLLMKQYLKTLFPNATAPELTELAYAFMMSTAGQAKGFVRQQGAGVMDLESATKATAYLTTTEGKRPKLQLDDSANGEFSISFKIHNVGTTDKTYTVGVTALTEDTFGMVYQGYHSDRVSAKMSAEICKRWGFHLVNPTAETVTLCNGTVKDVSKMVTLDGEKNVTVKAGETATVSLTLKANPELLDYFKEKCPAGMYLEGWIKLIDMTANNPVDLSIPYLGFVGDWDYPAMIDEGWWWQEYYGVNNMAQFYVSNVKGGIFAGYGDAEQGLGLNWYWDETGETYLADRNAISPNGDGYLDALTTLEFSLLRQPRSVKLYREFADGSRQGMYDASYAFRRETTDGVTSTVRGLSYSAIYPDYHASDLEENETATLVLEAYLDHDEFKLEDNKFAKIEIPVTKDTIAPVVKAIPGGVEIQDTNYVAYYAIYTDARHTDMVFEDGVFAMERGVKETYMTDMDEFFVAVADYAQNEAFYYITDGVAYLLDGEGFDHGRTIVGETHMINLTAANEAAEFAWYSFSEKLDQQPLRLTEITNMSDDLAKPAYKSETDIHGMGKGADGKIYGSSLSYLYTIDPVTFEKTKIARYKTEGKADTAIWAFNVSPAGKLYGVVGYDGNATKDISFCSIDPETAEITLLWSIKNYFPYRRGFDFVDEDTVIMVNQSGNNNVQYINVNDGTIEKAVDIGAKGDHNKSVLYSMYGYVQGLLYDEVENCIYAGGCMTKNRESRINESLIWKCDLDTYQLDYMVPGYMGGKGLFALTFLDELVDIPEQEHICYIKEVVEGDCLNDGYTLKVCAECGEEFKENVTEAKGHDYEAVVTEPTCTTLGYTTYTCANCGDSYKDDYTPTTDHVYGEWETVTAPTCNAKGQEKRTCVCGAAQYRDTDKTGHDYEAVVTAPTCTTLGYTTYTCTVCGDTYKSDFVETIGHKYTEEVVAPTCTDMGYTIFTCHCGHRYEGNFVAPTGHKFGEWTVTKEATCVENGEETRTCACGETETHSTFKTDHKYETAVVEPTCTEVGYTNHICTVCGHNYITDLTQPTGHDYEATVTAPTCTEDGYTTYTCTVCGESYVDDIVPATGHTFGEWVLTTEPGCTEAGEEIRYCADCDATETREVAPVCLAEKFTDVDTKQWYHEGVCYVIRNGLMNG